jgi:hypothetical protein
MHNCRENFEVLALKLNFSVHLIHFQGHFLHFDFLTHVTQSETSREKIKLFPIRCSPEHLRREPVNYKSRMSLTRRMKRVNYKAFGLP